MLGHVYISYDPTDQESADTVVKALEAGGIPCWISRRDLSLDTPNQRYDETIAWCAAFRESNPDLDIAIPDKGELIVWAAIRESLFLVLILTARTAVSGHVLRDVEVADEMHIPVIV